METPYTYPLYSPRECMEEERKLSKAIKKQTWAKKRADKDELARAPLIICSSAGNLTENIKKVCADFGAAQNIQVPVFLRGGKRISSLVKPEPLANKTCGRTNCFPCISGGGGDCD